MSTAAIARETRKALNKAIKADPTYYDGSVALRNVLTRLAKFPFMARLLTPFVMLELVAHSPHKGSGA